MQRPANRPRRGTLPIGTRVEVHSQLHESWSKGFEVAQTTEQGYWLRRESDRYLLPRPFLSNDVRRRS
jgi:hypothetical protein